MLQTVEISLPELLERVDRGQIPRSARVQVTYDDASSDDAATSDASQTQQDGARALFEQWAREDAEMSEEELEAERRLFEQFEKNVNETRRACGMRTL